MTLNHNSPLIFDPDYNQKDKMSTMSIPIEQSSDHEAAFVRLMHGKSAEERNAFFSMLKKDGQAHRAITDEYVQRWAEDSEQAREGRKEKYMSLVNKYVLDPIDSTTPR